MGLIKTILRNKSISLFFPKSDVCVVNYANDILVRVLSNNIIVDSIEKNKISEYIDESSLARDTSNVLIFGHPNKTKTTFQTISQQTIMPFWFDGLQYENCFAFVCYGSIVLKSLLWKSTFNKWVSFNGKVRMTIGGRKVKRIYKIFFDDISNFITDSEPQDNLIIPIKEIFDKHLDNATMPWVRHENIRATLVFLEAARDKLDSN